MDRKTITGYIALFPDIRIFREDYGYEYLDKTIAK